MDLPQGEGEHVVSRSGKGFGTLPCARPTMGRGRGDSYSIMTQPDGAKTAADVVHAVESGAPSHDVRGLEPDEEPLPVAAESGEIVPTSTPVDPTELDELEANAEQQHVHTAWQPWHVASG